MVIELTVRNTSPRRIERAGRIWPPGASTQTVSDARLGEVRACRHLHVVGGVPSPQPAAAGSSGETASGEASSAEQMVDRYTQAELRDAAARYGVSASGSKLEIAERIVAAIEGA